MSAIVFSKHSNKYGMAIKMTEVDKLSIKKQTVNILGFTDHLVSVTTTQFYHCSGKTPQIINKQYGYISKKLHLWKSGSNFFADLPISIIENLIR